MAASAVVDRGIRLGEQQRDYNHVSDPEYKKLRQQADVSYGRRQKLSAESQAAFKRGDKARAKELSDQAKVAMSQGDELNYRAAEYVFRENNADSGSNEIDLHGLFIKEAIYILKRRIVAGINRGEPTLEVIVGKGLHSKDGVAKLKPAVEELCNEANLNDHIDPKNTGVLVVDIRGAKIPSEWNVGPVNPQQPAAVYHAPAQQQQPQYYHQHPQQQQQQQQQQPSNWNQQQSHGGKTNNDLSKVLLKLFCMCFKNLTR